MSDSNAVVDQEKVRAGARALMDLDLSFETYEAIAEAVLRAAAEVAINDPKYKEPDDGGAA